MVDVKAGHQLSRTGNQQLKAALRRIALTRAHWDEPAKQMMKRELAIVPVSQPLHRSMGRSRHHVDNNPARAALRATRTAWVIKASSMGSPVVTMR